MSYLFMYLLTRVDFVISFVQIFSFLGWAAIAILGIVALICLIVACQNERDKKEVEKFLKNVNSFINLKKWITGLIIITLFCNLCYGLIPDLKSIAVIYLVPKIVNNEEVQELPENVIKMFNSKLEDWIKDNEK